MSEPGLFAQLVGRIAFVFAEIQPLIPTYLHIILSAIFPIYTAAYASLSRPTSAAKPKKDRTGTSQGEEEDEEDDEYQRMEGLTPSDALLFPIFAGVALTTLYFLIKWLQDPAILNKILNWYFGIVGLYGVCKFISDAFHIIHAFIFPLYYLGGSGIWQVDQGSRRAVLMAASEGEQKTRNSPLPGLLSLLPIPKKMLGALWTIRSLSTPSKKLTLRFYIHRVVALRVHFDAFSILSLILGSSAVLYFNFIDKPWWITNLIGFSFSYSTLQLMSPTTFVTGSMLLMGLFLYDIYMVFFTPMMVTVAKNLDIPIKLLFPRPPKTPEAPDTPAVRDYAMLGLGDIVLPGLLIAMSLRYDLYLHYLRLQKKEPSSDESSTSDTSSPTPKEITIKAPYVTPSKHWSSRFWTSGSATLPHLSDGTFKKTYFTASLTGYIIGMITTLGAMQISAHPQPALLYLVPGVLISLVLTAWVRGEVRQMWNFTEEEEQEEEATKETGEVASNGGTHAATDSSTTATVSKAKEKQPKRSFFSLSRDETDSPILRAANKLVESGHRSSSSSSSEDDESGVQRKRRLSQAKVERLEQSVRATANREWFHLSVSGYKLPKATDKKKRGEKKTWVESSAVEKKRGLEAAHVAKKLRTA
jgi:minor histocompatibility antigen H13